MSFCVRSIKDKSLRYDRKSFAECYDKILPNTSLARTGHTVLQANSTCEQKHMFTETQETREEGKKTTTLEV